MGLSLGAQALWSSASRHDELPTLAASEPLEFFVSKFIGLAIAIGSAIVIGFALATLTIGYIGRGEGMNIHPAHGLTVLLAWASLSIRYLISSVSRRTASALSVSSSSGSCSCSSATSA